MNDKIVEIKELCAACHEPLGEEPPYQVELKKYCETCFDQKFFVCTKCRCTNPFGQSYSVEDDQLCLRCFEAEYIHCFHCEHVTKKASATPYNDGWLCEGCYEDDYFCCESCNRTLHNDDYGADGYCNRCNDSDEDRESCDTFRAKEIECVVKPNTLPLPWTFGFEVEVDWGEDDEVDLDLVDAVRAHTPFGAHHDGSLDNGVEFVSPLLRADAGLAILETFCKHIRFAPVRKTCGLHLHLGTADCSWVDMKKIWLLYQQVEPGLYALLPPDRRESNYCRPQPQTPRYTQTIVRIHSKKELIHALYDYFPKKRLDYKICKDHHDRFDKRYSGLNLHSHFFRRTLELRYHSGTVKYQKMRHWLILHMALCKFAVTSSEKELLRLAEPSRKPEQLLDFFQQPICAGYPDTQAYLAERFLKFNT